MKQTYVNMQFNAEQRAMLRVVDEIVRDYQSQGFMLTVRQIYYQLVARDLFPDSRRYAWVEGKWKRDPDGTPNAEPNYKWIAGVINDGKLAGLLDWDAIEDRTREFIKRTRWDSPSAILKAVAAQYHEDMWTGQDVRPFVVVEKEALAGVLQGVCADFDVPLLAARGYPSGSVLREFCVDDVLPTIRANQAALVIHLGDHDPSGIDMSRDLTDRMELFTQRDGFDLIRVALNMDQIDEQKPPPNPAKTTDSRFRGYMDKFGDESWELDALQPAYLVKLVRKHITKCIDDKADWKARQADIDAKKARLLTTADEWASE